MTKPNHALDLPVITFWELSEKLGGLPDYILHKWIRVGTLPKPRSLGNITFWSTAELAKWEADRVAKAAAVIEAREAAKPAVLARRAQLAREARWAKVGKPSIRHSPYGTPLAE